MKLPNNKSERSPLGRRLGGETIRSKKGEGCSDDTDMAHRQEVLEEYVLKSAAVFPTARCQTIFLIVEYICMNMPFGAISVISGAMSYHVNI